MAGRAPITVSFQKKSDLTPLLKEALRKMGDSYATVGVHNDAGEYQVGPDEQPTPVYKVAYWLEHGTQSMPARPFMAPTIAAKHAAIQRTMAQALANVAILKQKPVDALRRVGFSLQVWIQNAIKSNVPPPLSKRYLRRRKEEFPEAGNRTLVASSLLLRSIRYVLWVDGKRVDDHAPAHGDAPAQAPEGPRTREQARTAAAVDKLARKKQREYAKQHPEEAAERFRRQRRRPH